MESSQTPEQKKVAPAEVGAESAPVPPTPAAVSEKKTLFRAAVSAMKKKRESLSRTIESLQKNIPMQFGQEKPPPPPETPEAEQSQRPEAQESAEEQAASQGEASQKKPSSAETTDQKETEEEAAADKNTFEKIGDMLQKVFALIQKLYRQIQGYGSSALKSMAKSLRAIGFEKPAMFLEDMATSDFAALKDARGDLKIKEPVRDASADDPEAANKQYDKETEAFSAKLEELGALYRGTQGYDKVAYFRKVVEAFKKSHPAAKECTLEELIAAAKGVPPVNPDAPKSTPEAAGTAVSFDSIGQNESLIGKNFSLSIEGGGTVAVGVLREGDQVLLTVDQKKFSLLYEGMPLSGALQDLRKHASGGIVMNLGEKGEILLERPVFLQIAKTVADGQRANATAADYSVAGVQAVVLKKGVVVTQDEGTKTIPKTFTFRRV